MHWFPILTFSHYTVFLSEIFLIIAILYLNPASNINRIAAIQISCFALWSLGEVFLSVPGTPQNLAELVYSVYSIGWIFFSSFSLLFALLFVEKTALFKSKIFSAIIILLPVLFCMAFWSGNLQYPIEKIPFGWAIKWKYNIFTYFFYFYYLSFMFVCIWLYLNNAIKSTNPVKKNLSFILVFALCFSLLCGTFLEIILPRISNTEKMFASAGDISVIFWVAGLFYSILRYRFMTLSPETNAEDIIANMSEALVILNEFFVITLFNKAALQLFGCNEIDLKNRPFTAFFTDSSISNNWLKANIINRKLQGYETSLLKKDRSIIPVMISSSVIYRQGDIMGLICIVSDVTLQKLAAQELKESYEKLLELDKLKESFLSMVSHELRTPLTSIKGFLSFLLNGVAGPTTPRQKEFLEIIQSNSDRLLFLINELLDVSKMTSGSFSIQKSECDIIKTVNTSIKDMASLLDKKKITISLETGLQSLKISADEYRISQAIINLFNNAIKFSKLESRITIGIDLYTPGKFDLPLNIAAFLSPDKKYLYLYVKDEGVGLSIEQRQKLFTRFYQAENINTRTAQGTGLGLYITKVIVQLHEGYIWADSEGLNKGTTIYLLLPVQ